MQASALLGRLGSGQRLAPGAYVTGGTSVSGIRCSCGRAYTCESVRRRTTARAGRI